MKNKVDFALATSALLLVAAWVSVSTAFPAVQITGWVGLVSTAALFLTGGGTVGLKASLWTGVVGIGLTALGLQLLSMLGGGLLATVVVLSLLAFILVVISPLPGMSAIAVSFLGACCFIAADVPPGIEALWVIWSWVAGLALGFGVGALAGWLMSATSGNRAADHAQ